MLYYAAKEKYPPKKTIQKWLNEVDSYTLHKPARRKFPTNHVIVHSIDRIWQTDLVDLSSLQKFSLGYRYILTCIEILSKYVWAIPLKTKRVEEIVKAFQSIVPFRKPKSRQSDFGKEYRNPHLQRYLMREGFRFFTTNNNTKVSLVERFNRILKTKIWKYFTQNHTCNYIDVFRLSFTEL